MPIKRIDVKDLRKTFSVDVSALKQLDEQGTATARIAIIGVKDHDGDIMAPGAFTDGEVITILPTHQWSAQPLGKGKIRVSGTDVLVDMVFNLESQAAKEWHSWLKFDMDPKNGEAIQEWSWGWDWKNLDFEVIRHEGEEVRLFKSVPVIEASPVLRGAGSSTGTVAVKSKKTAEHLAQTDGERAFWSKAVNLAHYTKDDAATLHHFVDEDGEPGEASVKACLNEIAVLNGKRAGAVVNPAAKQAIYDHLAAHLKSAGIDAPPLDLAAHCGLKFADEVNAVIDALYESQDLLNGLSARIKGLVDTRAADGRTISDAKVAEINKVVEAMQGLEILEVKDLGDSDVTDQLLKIKLLNIQKGLD